MACHDIYIKRDNKYEFLRNETDFFILDREKHCIKTITRGRYTYKTYDWGETIRITDYE